MIPEGKREAGMNRKRSWAATCHDRGPAAPEGSAEAGTILQSCSELGYRVQAFRHSQWPVCDEAALGRSMSLGAWLSLWEVIPKEAWWLGALLAARGRWVPQSWMASGWFIRASNTERVRSLCVARGKAPRGRKLSSKAEGHSEVRSSVSNNQELTVVYGLTC